MDKELMVEILKGIECDLKKELKDNEAVIRLPIVVSFNEKGDLDCISKLYLQTLYDQYNK